MSLLYAVGAVGVGVVYTVAVNTAVKWFPDRRGLTTGAGTMAFAAGSALFVPYVRASVTTGAFAGALRNVGLSIVVGVVVGGAVLRDPPAGFHSLGGSTSVPNRNGDRPAARDPSATGRRTDEIGVGRQFTWREALRTREFRLMYAMFVCIAGATLMLTANLVAFAENLGFAGAIATISATVLPVADGIGRLGVGTVSDRIGRERSMLVGFSLCGGGLFALTLTGAVGTAAGFLGAVVLTAAFEGTQYTLFPSAVADYFGHRHSSTIYAVLFSAKVVGGVVGGVGAAWLVTVVGWSVTFAAGGVLAILAGIGASVLGPPAESPR